MDVDNLVLLLLHPAVAPGFGLLGTLLAVIVKGWRQGRWDTDMYAAITTFIGACTAPVALGLMLSALGTKLPPLDQVRLYLAVAGIAMLYMAGASLRQFFVRTPMDGTESATMKKEAVPPAGTGVSSGDSAEAGRAPERTREQ